MLGIFRRPQAEEFGAKSVLAAADIHLNPADPDARFAVGPDHVDLMAAEIANNVGVREHEARAQLGRYFGISMEQSGKEPLIVELPGAALERVVEFTLCEESL